MPHIHHPKPQAVQTKPGLEAMCHVLAEEPVFGILELGDGLTLLTWGTGEVVGPDDAWLETLSAAESNPAGPWSSGWTGWVAYETGAQFERMRVQPPRPDGLPALCFWRHEGTVVHHARTNTWTIKGSPAFTDEAKRKLAMAARPRAPQLPLVPGPSIAPPPGEEAYFKKMVASALLAISRGDIYQVNLSWEIRDIPVQNPLQSYLALRQANPASRGGFMRVGPWTLLSNSPELFLDLRPTPAGLQGRSIPIKGTAPNCSQDSHLVLQRSEKEQAELTMITDLVRNDLGRVARPGGVHASPRRIRVCGDLLHAEQEIVAQMRPEVDAVDVLRASFPPGSVTGAPKVRAMELIHELERGPRGAYTGTIGTFFDDGRAHLSVAIRTATIHEHRASFHVGAGIVADSNPEQEWRETLAKGNMLHRWLSARC